MNAFGRDVASRTIAGVLAGIILAALAAAYKFAPALVDRFAVTPREAFTGVAAAVLVAGSVALALVWSRLPVLKKAPPPAKPSSVTLSLNHGVKPSVTLTHHGPPTSYRVDGRIVEHLDGTPVPQPARSDAKCSLAESWVDGTLFFRTASGRTSS